MIEENWWLILISLCILSVTLMAITSECNYCKRPIFRRRDRVCRHCRPIARQLEAVMRDRDSSAS